MTFKFDDVPFEQRLAEAIAWAAPRASVEDPARSLRTYELQPWVLAPDRAWAVDGVLRQRATYLGVRPAAARERAHLPSGQLLVYFPDRNLSDGAAEVQSRGFFDVENVPPWDTWIALRTEPQSLDVDRKTYLISWVPQSLIDLAQRGIDVNPEECICWLRDASIGAREELRRFLG